MAFWSWSRTAGTNATADSTINWAEGQAPSSINDSARAMMARTAEWRDDVSGATTTGGSSAAYTLTTYQVFDTLAHMNGQMIAFTPHATNTGSGCSLAVDGLTARNIRSSPNVDLPAGTLIQGTPYVVIYNNSDGIFYLRGFFGNPYNIPIGGSIEYWGTSAPNSSFVFPYGQAISRTTYSTLFALLGTTHGVGDGSTTFNLPDLRGRVAACPDNMGGSDANRLVSSASMAAQRNGIGGVGGESAHTLITSEMPSHNHTATDSGHTHPQASNTLVASGGAGNYGPGGNPISAAASTTQAGTASITVGNTGGGGAHDNVQPTILCNRIIRVI